MPRIVEESLGSLAQPLDHAVRGPMESLFRHDFGHVRIHADRQAEEAARAVDSRAFTVGSHIVFGAAQWAPRSSAGIQLLAHELTHVVQQGASAAAAPHQAEIGRDDKNAEREADAVALGVTTGGSQVCPADVGASVRPNLVQRQRARLREPTDAERSEFEEEQKRFLAELGEVMETSILERAGFVRGRRPRTPDQALQVTALWGLSLDVLVARMPQLKQSTSSRLSEGPTPDLAERQQQALAALSPAGRRAYDDIVNGVRAEPFWRELFEAGEVVVLPDQAGGENRGFTEHVPVQRGGRSITVHVVHLNRDTVEAGAVGRLRATLVHELSHTLYEPAVVYKALLPFEARLANLIVNHPRLEALRRGAADPAAARRAQVVLVAQAIYERTGLAEEEIFVRLQELSHIPGKVTEQGEEMRGVDFVLDQVEVRLEQLRRLGLPAPLLHGVIEQMARRVTITYERRIDAATDQRIRQGLEVNRRLALSLLRLALNEVETAH